MFALRKLTNFNSKYPIKILKYTRTASTVADQLSKWTEKLSKEQISEPESSVRNLLAHVLQTRDLTFIDKSSTKQLSDSQIKELEELCLARLCHMPVQYIIKEWDFRELKGLKMVPPVFIPRPETEELVSHVISDFLNRDTFNFLEIGCGSGVISISLLKEFGTRTNGYCFDQNQLAVELTKINAEIFDVIDRLTVEKFKLTDGNLSLEMKNQKFDLIVSNPPYLFSRELVRLADDIKVFEDLRALDGGRDGLVVINNILQVAEKHLNENGCLWLEVHERHPTMIRDRIEKSSSLVFTDIFKDFNGKDRFIKIVKKFT